MCSWYLHQTAPICQSSFYYETADLNSRRLDRTDCGAFLFCKTLLIHRPGSEYSSMYLCRQGVDYKSGQLNWLHCRYLYCLIMGVLIVMCKHRNLWCLFCWLEKCLVRCGMQDKLQKYIKNEIKQNTFYCHLIKKYIKKESCAVSTFGQIHIVSINTPEAHLVHKAYVTTDGCICHAENSIWGLLRLTICHYLKNPNVLNLAHLAVWAN